MTNGEDVLKRTMALIDEHKDKFSDGVYLDLANNLHKAWSTRRDSQRSQLSFLTAGTNTQMNAEYERDPTTGFYPPRRRPMTLAQPQARVEQPPPPSPPPPPPPRRVEPYRVKGTLFSPEEGRLHLEFKCQNGFSTGFSPSPAGTSSAW